MRTFGMAVLGHRPTKIFILTSTGRIDRTVGRFVLWVSVHTWGRWTRWLPQNIVTLVTLAYFVTSMTWLWRTKEYLGIGIYQVLVFGFVCVFLEWKSWKLRRLSGHLSDVQVGDIIEARSLLFIRLIALMWLVFSGSSLAITYNLDQVVAVLISFFYVWALYTLTMGRTLPPKKAKRRLRDRLPSLPKLRLPKPIPVPS